MKKDKDIFLGELASLSDSSVDAWPGFMADSRKGTPETQALYEYRKLGTIDGIPVRPEDRNLSFSDEDELRSAMQLRRRERVFLEWLSPDSGKDKYEELLEKVNSGSVMVEDHTLQYDAAKSAFLALVRYCEVEYALSPRFEFKRNR